MVHGAALEKRSVRKRSVGSNPTLSAMVSAQRLSYGFSVEERCWSGLSGAPGERV